MKPLLFVLLAASLAANVVLGLRARSVGSPAVASSSSTVPSSNASALSSAAGPVEAGGSASTATRGSPSDGAATAAAAIAGSLDWRPHGTEADLHRLVTNLRTAGYPPSVVRAVVNQLLNERFAARQPQHGQPFWKQAAPSAEMVAAQNALSQERQALFETLLGADARPSATLDSATRQRRYGNLSDAKIDAIAQIERDYNEMTSESWAKRRGNAADASVAMQSQQLMEAEKFADLAAILTPEELAQYEMRNSSSARKLVNQLRNTAEVSETEFTQLYQAVKAFDTANPPRTFMDAAAAAQRQAAQTALNEQARAILTEDRFYAYLQGADFAYARVTQALQPFPTVTPATAYQVYQLQNDLQVAMSEATRGGQLSAEKTAELRTTVESYNNRLESLIGAEAAEAYRKQGSGRMFSSFRNAPSRAGQPASR